MKDDITLRIMDGDYVLSPFAARKLRESLMLALGNWLPEPQVSTPLHPSAKGNLTY